MLLSIAKNGKEYRCDQCQKLLGVDKVRYLRISPIETYHFCTWAHRQSFITSRHNLPIPFVWDCAPATGDVIPVKNPGSNS